MKATSIFYKSKTTKRLTSAPYKKNVKELHKPHQLLLGPYVVDSTPLILYYLLKRHYNIPDIYADAVKVLCLSYTSFMHKISQKVKSG